jgi:hypothetical protein
VSDNISYDAAFAITTLCVCAYYAGARCRLWVPEYLLGGDAIAAGRFVALPLMLTTAIVMAMMLFTARSSFDDKQDLISDMASNALQLDRMLTFFGGPQAGQAQLEYRDYLQYLIANPKAIWELADRTKAEKFAVDIQSLPIPKGDTGVAKSSKEHMLDLMSKLSRDRFHLATKAQRVIYPFSMSILLIWLVAMFSFMGVTSPMLNGPSFWFSVVAAACVGSISFLIVEYTSSSAGFITLDMAPFDLVLRNIGGA